MSKSLGNVINPLQLIDDYGVDSVRFFLMRDMVLGMDATFTIDSFIKRYNSDLANDYGNLVNRVTMLIIKHFDGKIPQSGDYNETDLELIAKAKTIPQIVRKLFGEMKIHDSVENIMSLMRKVNAYLEIKAPWKTIKIDSSHKSNAATTMALSADVLRIGSQLLNPVIPEKSQSILNMLGASSISLSDISFGKLKAGTILGKGQSPFPRIITE